MNDLRLLTINIGNPSIVRARAQLDWFAGRPEHVLVLTETGPGIGSAFLAEQFTLAGWTAVWQPPAVPGERGVLLAARVAVQPGGCTQSLDYLPARAASLLVPTTDGTLEVVGLYVPNRDASQQKIIRKQRFCAGVELALAGASGRVMILGDLNVLEPDHHPHYRSFREFEYEFYNHLTSRLALVDAFRRLHPKVIEHSWIGRKGHGYRYDHALASAALAPQITDCGYIHEPRERRLSDHAALTVSLRIPAPPLIGSNPATAGTASKTR